MYMSQAFAEIRHFRKWLSENTQKNEFLRTFEFQFKLELKFIFDFKFYVKTQTQLYSKFRFQNLHWLKR